MVEGFDVRKERRRVPFPDPHSRIRRGSFSVGVGVGEGGRWVDAHCLILLIDDSPNLGLG